MRLLFCAEVKETKRFTVFSAVFSTTPNLVSGVMCQIWSQISGQIVSDFDLIRWVHLRSEERQETV